MKNSEQQLLNNLYGFMKQRPVSCILEQEREWEELLSMSFAHKILPMIYDSMGKSDMLASIPLKYQAIWRSATWSDVAQQVRKTELFWMCIVRFKKPVSSVWY